jgi:tetratricopeptide (TPR) repeat protein
MYVPLAAIVPLLVVAVYEVIRRAADFFSARPRAASNDRRPLVMATLACAAVALVFGLVTAHRLIAYQDGLTILEDALVYQPEDYLIRNGLGAELAKAGRADEAIAHLEYGLRLNPDAPLLHYNIALALEQDRRVPEAIAHYAEAVRLRPRYAQAHYNLGLLYHEYGNQPEAEVHYRAALDAKPAFAAAQTNLGTLLSSEGRLTEAIEHLEEGSRLNPNAAAYIHLVDAYVLAGENEKAASAAKRAVELARAEGREELADHIEAWLASRAAAASAAESADAPSSPGQ